MIEYLKLCMYVSPKLKKSAMIFSLMFYLFSILSMNRTKLKGTWIKGYTSLIKIQDDPSFIDDPWITLIIGQKLSFTLKIMQDILYSVWTVCTMYIVHCT